VQFSDFDAVAELKQRWGIAGDSLENWETLWPGDPALMAQRTLSAKQTAHGLGPGRRTAPWSDTWGTFRLQCRYGRRATDCRRSSRARSGTSVPRRQLTLTAAFFPSEIGRSLSLYHRMRPWARWRWPSSLLPASAGLSLVLFWSCTVSLRAALMTKLNLGPANRVDRECRRCACSRSRQDPPETMAPDDSNLAHDQ